jgi:hypothetical protein
MQIEEIIDPPEYFYLIADRTVAPQVYDRIARRHDPGCGAVARDVEPVADVKHSGRQREQIDRQPGCGRAPLLLRPAQQLQAGTGVDRAGKGVIGADSDAVRNLRRNEAFGALGRCEIYVRVRGEGVVGCDEVSDAVMEVGPPEPDPVVEQGLLEAGVITLALLRL